MGEAFKNFFVSLWNGFKKDIIYIAVIIVMVCWAITSMRSCTNALQEKEISDQNYKAATNELVIVKTKLKDANATVAIKDAFIAESKKEAEEMIGKKDNKIKELEKIIGSKITYIAELESQLETGPIIIQKDSIVYVKDTNIIESHFKYQDNWLSLSGITKIENNEGSTTINNIYMGVPLTVGLSEDFKIFVKTENPYVSFTDIQGAVIDSKIINTKKKKRWAVGVNAGFGVHYNIPTKSFGYGPQVGVGVSIGF